MQVRLGRCGVAAMEIKRSSMTCTLGNNNGLHPHRRAKTVFLGVYPYRPCVYAFANAGVFQAG